MPVRNRLFLMRSRSFLPQVSWVSRQNRVAGNCKNMGLLKLKMSFNSPVFSAKRGKKPALLFGVGAELIALHRVAVNLIAGAHHVGKLCCCHIGSGVARTLGSAVEPLDTVLGLNLKVAKPAECHVLVLNVHKGPGKYQFGLVLGIEAGCFHCHIIGLMTKCLQPFKGCALCRRKVVGRGNGGFQVHVFFAVRGNQLLIQLLGNGGGEADTAFLPASVQAQGNRVGVDFFRAGADLGVAGEWHFIATLKGLPLTSQCSAV